MKIAILSDTHIRKHTDKFNQFVNTHLQEADLILHAGDYTSSKVIELLKNHKPFCGVFGNNDKDAIRKIIKEKEILELCGYRIGIYHGHGGKGATLEKAYEEFKDQKVDIIIFGHSHLPLVLTKNKTLMINPGSPTSKRKERWYSYALLTLQKDSLQVELKFFPKLM